MQSANPFQDYLNLAMTISTIAMALFAFSAWRIDSRDYARTHTAKLRVATAKSLFERSRREVRVEILLINEYGAPAVIENWTVLIRDGNFQEEVSDGKLVPTTLLKSPGFIGYFGWLVGGHQAVALSLKKTLAKEGLSENTTAHFEISYTGGKKEVVKVSFKAQVKIV